MPKEEKKGGDAAAKAAALEAERQELIAALVSNFAAACKLTGFPPAKELEAALQPAEGRDPACISARGAVGAPNVRALCAAVLARGAGLAPRAYSLLRTLTLQDAAAGDSGAAAVGEVLRNGCLVGCLVESVSLVRCGVGVEGASALGASLMLGACPSLTHLCLDHNSGLGDAGLRALCRGLATNRTLTRLSLAACGAGAEGAEEVAAVLNSPTCVLEALDLSGNDIGLEGLRSLAVAASYSRTLAELLLCNCGLSSKSALDGAMLALARSLRGGAGLGGGEGSAGGGGSGGGSGGGGGSGAAAVGGGASLLAAPAAGAAAAAAPAPASAAAAAGAGGGSEAGALSAAAAAAAARASAGGLDGAAVQATGAEAFSALGRALASTECALGRVDLDGNPLTDGDAAALVPFLKEAPPKVTLFRVPIGIRPEHFAVLFKNVVAKKKKGGKAKK